MIQERLKTAIQNAAKAAGLDVGELQLEHPADLSNGDYSTNVAMLAGGNPKEKAEKIISELEEINLPEIEKIEVAGSGFINFFLSRDFFTESIVGILMSGEKFGRNTNLKGKKVMVEHTQPNPFKPFHVGHLVNNSIGEAFVRLLKFSGADVYSTTYHGDVGMHVAKTIWAMTKNKVEPNNVATDVWNMGFMYSVGNLAFEKDSEEKREIEEINRKIYERDSEIISKYYEPGKKISLKHFEEIYKRMGSKFDNTLFESDAGVVGKKIVEEHMGKEFVKSAGAVVFEAQKLDPVLHTRVFINSEGLPTYEAKDLGLVYLKKDIFDFDLSITLTDVEQGNYFQVVKKAIEVLDPEVASKLLYLQHGRLRLPGGRLSSRRGDIVSGEQLLNDLQAKVIERLDDKAVADQIAVAALKYSILKQSPSRNIVFDNEKSLSFEGDSGPYLQYTYVRAQSILEKAGESKLEPNVGKLPKDVNPIEKLLYRFPEVAKRAAAEYSPQYVATYLAELAGSFNAFYAKERIVDSKDEYSPFKLSLTKAVSTVLKNGLWLLGIEAPPRM